MESTENGTKATRLSFTLLATTESRFVGCGEPPLFHNGDGRKRGNRTARPEALLKCKTVGGAASPAARRQEGETERYSRETLLEI